MSDRNQTVRVVIRGRVQGVGFRAWARARARELGLSGSVRNQPDGSVSAVIHGETPAIDAMLEALCSGPPSASVTDVRHEDAEGTAVPDGFEIRA